MVKLKPGDGLVRRKKIYPVTAKRTQDLNSYASRTTHGSFSLLHYQHINHLADFYLCELDAVADPSLSHRRRLSFMYMQKEKWDLIVGAETRICFWLDVHHMWWDYVHVLLWSCEIPPIIFHWNDSEMELWDVPMFCCSGTVTSTRPKHTKLCGKDWGLHLCSWWQFHFPRWSLWLLHPNMLLRIKFTVHTFNGYSFGWH